MSTRPSRNGRQIETRNSRYGDSIITTKIDFLQNEFSKKIDQKLARIEKTKNEINETPGLFIFLIDQSGSMYGKPIEIVRKSYKKKLSNINNFLYIKLLADDKKVFIRWFFKRYYGKIGSKGGK